MKNIKTFDSIEDAIEIIRELVINEDWRELGQYFFLTGSPFCIEDTLCRDFYCIDRFGDPRTLSNGDIVFPFPPDYTFCETLDISEEITAVIVGKSIDLGEGATKEAWDWFYLVELQEGLALLPEKGNDPYLILREVLLNSEEF